MSGRLLSMFGAGLDRSVLPCMRALWVLGRDPNSPDAVADQQRAFDTYSDSALLRDPSIFFPEPPPATIEVSQHGRMYGGRLERLRWWSGYRTWDPQFQPAYDRFRRNTVAHAEALFHDDPGHPTLMCLHSWATGYYRLQRWAMFVRPLFHAGVNVVVMMLPFHGPRNPVGSPFGGHLFPGNRVQHTNEAFGQAVWDVRSIVAWLAQRQAGPIGLMGQSLGGYLTALIAGLEPRLHWCIPMIPMVSMADLMWSLGRHSRHRRRAEARGVTLQRLRDAYAIHSPLRYEPLVPHARRMIVAGRGDRICPPEHIEELWEHWDRPTIHWFPGSHLAHFGRAAATDAVIEFITESTTPS